MIEIPPTYSRTVKLPFGYQVTLAMYGDPQKPEGTYLLHEWQPCVPWGSKKQPPMDKLFFAYRRARDQFFEDIATMQGGSVVIVGNGPNGYETTEIKPGAKH